MSNITPENETNVQPLESFGDHTHDSERGSSSHKKRTIILALIILVAVIVLSVFAYTKTQSTRTPLIMSEELLLEAIKAGDPSLAQNLPDPDTLLLNSESDVRNVFNMAQLSFAYQLSSRNEDYLLKIVDTPGSTTEIYRSIAAYFLLHIFYDTHDIAKQVGAIQSSSFLSGYTEVAASFFPEIFEKDIATLTGGEQSLYVAAYFMALGDRGDSVVFPANAAHELVRAYRLYRETADYNPESEKAVQYRRYITEQLRIASERLRLVYTLSYPGKLIAHDVVSGSNNFALAVHLIRDGQMENEFPIVQDWDIIALHENAYGIAKMEVPALKKFTTYLYALRSAERLEPKEILNDETVDLLVRELVGNAPFTDIGENSWAYRRLSEIENAKAYPYYWYTKEAVATIARKSELMRQFLTSEGGWEPSDWELRD